MRETTHPFFANPQELADASEWLDTLLTGYIAEARRGKPHAPEDVFVYLITWYEGWISESDDPVVETDDSLREAVMLAATAIARLANGDPP